MLIEQVTNVNNLTLQRLWGLLYPHCDIRQRMGIAGMWIGPFFSTWSDRLRTKYGRRRPILFIAAPLFALSLIAIPFMPDLYHFLMRVSWAAALLRHIPGMGDPKRGQVLFFGTGCFVNTLFNMVVLAVFAYYYWDVVPKEVLGRFQSMARNVTVAALLVWNFYILGRAEDHLKAVYIGVSLICLAIYLLSIWRVKEGEYPPPEQRARKGPFEPIRVYFADCFSKPYYLWIFVGYLLRPVEIPMPA